MHPMNDSSSDLQALVQSAQAAFDAALTAAQAASAQLVLPQHLAEAPGRGALQLQRPLELGLPEDVIEERARFELGLVRSDELFFQFPNR